MYLQALKFVDFLSLVPTAVISLIALSDESWAPNLFPVHRPFCEDGQRILCILTQLVVGDEVR